MKVSIITVCKNAAATIADTLNSVASQTWGAIEHIIIDGGSTDHTIEIIQSFPHVTKFISEQDRGVYFAMNKGISMATGEIVGILNADDYYSNDGIIEQVVIRFRQKSCAALYGNLFVVKRTDKFKIIRNWRAGQYQLIDFYHGWSPPHPTLFLMRSLYEQYGAFDTRFTLAADYELMLRLLFKHKVKAYYLDAVLVVMRSGGLSNRSIYAKWVANREDKKAWEVNGLKPHLFTLILKPLTKIKQFIFTWQK